MHVEKGKDPYTSRPCCRIQNSNHRNHTFCARKFLTTALGGRRPLACIKQSIANLPVRTSSTSGGLLPKSSYRRNPFIIRFFSIAWAPRKTLLVFFFLKIEDHEQLDESHYQRTTLRAKSCEHQNSGKKRSGKTTSRYRYHQ